MILEIKQINDAIGRETYMSSYLLTDVASAYSEASGALGEAIDKAFSEDDTQQIAVLRQLLVDRIARARNFRSTISLGEVDLQECGRYGYIHKGNRREHV